MFGSLGIHKSLISFLVVFVFLEYLHNAESLRLPRERDAIPTIELTRINIQIGSSKSANSNSATTTDTKTPPTNDAIENLAEDTKIIAKPELMQMKEEASLPEVSSKTTTTVSEDSSRSTEQQDISDPSNPTKSDVSSVENCSETGNSKTSTSGSTMTDEAGDSKTSRKAETSKTTITKKYVVGFLPDVTTGSSKATITIIEDSSRPTKPHDISFASNPSKSAVSSMIPIKNFDDVENRKTLISAGTISDIEGDTKTSFKPETLETEISTKEEGSFLPDLTTGSSKTEPHDISNPSSAANSDKSSPISITNSADTEDIKTSKSAATTSNMAGDKSIETKITTKEEGSSLPDVTTGSSKATTTVDEDSRGPTKPHSMSDFILLTKPHILSAISTTNSENAENTKISTHVGTTSDMADDIKTSTKAESVETKIATKEEGSSISDFNMGSRKTTRATAEDSSILMKPLTTADSRDSVKSDIMSAISTTSSDKTENTKISSSAAKTSDMAGVSKTATKPETIQAETPAKTDGSYSPDIITGSSKATEEDFDTGTKPLVISNTSPILKSDTDSIKSPTVAIETAIKQDFLKKVGNGLLIGKVHQIHQNKPLHVKWPVTTDIPPTVIKKGIIQKIIDKKHATTIKKHA